MKKILLSFIFIFSLIDINQAQVAVFQSKSFVDSISQPGLKKYGVKLSFDGINVPVVFSMGTMQNLQIAYYGDSIPNLRNSNSTLQELNSSFFAMAKNENNTDGWIGDIIDVFPFSKNILTIPNAVSPTGSNNNGKIYLNIDTTDNQISNVVLIYRKVSDFSPIPLALNTQHIDYLYSDSYFINVSYKFQDSISMSETAIVLIGNYAFPSATGLNIEVNPYETTPTLCDGAAYVSITNSSIPFSCSFDGGSNTSSHYINNLCEGMHRVLVTTSNETIGKYYSITNDNNVVNNSNSNGIVVDTIIYNLTNCHFNYNLPIDSAYLTDYMVIDTNTIYLSWEIWQQGISSTISDTISFLYQTGNNMISLNIFCGSGRTSSTNSFKTFRINDYAFLSNSVTAIKGNKKLQDFTIFPNPFSNVITIKSRDLVDIKKVIITNVIGENTDIEFKSNDKEILLNTEKLKSGFYTISIINKSGKISSAKIIKQ